MEILFLIGIFAILVSAVIGIVYTFLEDDITCFFIGLFVGVIFFAIFALFGVVIGPIGEESIASPETRIEIVSPEGEVTFFDEGDFKIQEITDDFIKYSEDGEKITIYIEDGSKVKVIDLEE